MALIKEKASVSYVVVVFKKYAAAAARSLHANHVAFTHGNQ